MMEDASITAAGLAILSLFGIFSAAGPAFADDVCLDCIQVRVGPPAVVRGPFPDELDAPFTALQLPDGSFRGFSANGATYAIDGSTLWDMDGPRRAVLEAGPAGSLNECGRWLTSSTRSGESVIGFVHQESICNYGPQGQTHKSMAIATSGDHGLTWSDMGTVITGRDKPRQGTTTGEGDCTMVDGFDGYFYAYCLRNSDWQTIVLRAAASDPTEWRKYFQGAWREPGLGGNADAIGFLGPGAGYLSEHGAVATVTTDPWFGGVRLSLSSDKVSFLDLDEPLIAIDGADWERPADTALIAYETLVNPEDGSNVVGDHFLLSYIYVPPGRGFESRYLVHHDVTLTVAAEPQGVQVGMALTRWVDRALGTFVTSTGPLTAERSGFQHDALVTYMLTSAPEGVASLKISECSQDSAGRLDHLLAEAGECEAIGYDIERTAGWLYAVEQPGAVPVYRCYADARRAHFVSVAPDCEGLGTMKLVLGYGVP